VEKALLHAIVCTNILENVPGKGLVQLPSNETHYDSDQPDDGRNSDEIGADV
jgi:hypothetical protein